MDKSRTGAIDKSHSKKINSTLSKKKNKIIRQNGKINVKEAFRPLEMPAVTKLIFTCEDTLCQIDHIFRREYNMSLADALQCASKK